jgi:hypothetical protein
MTEPRADEAGDCPTCGTQVRENRFWSPLAGPTSPRVYYPQSIMNENPEIAHRFTRCPDSFHDAAPPAATAPSAPRDEAAALLREVATLLNGGDTRPERDICQRIDAYLRRAGPEGGERSA